MLPADVTVIIPTCGRVELLRGLLPRYLDEDPVSEVIVVWDGSGPEPTFALDGVRVMRNHRTRGLPGARNAGLDACSTPFFCFGEDDAWPEPGAIAEMRAVWAPGRLVGPNLFEQLQPEQTAAEVREQLVVLGKRRTRWRMAWTNDVYPSDRAVQRGVTALVLGKLDEFDGVRFDEGIVGPTFHMEDIDFQLSAIEQGILPFMATRAHWVHLFRESTGSTGSRDSRALGRYIASVYRNDLRVYRRHRDVIRARYGLRGVGDFVLLVSTRAALRRLIWYVDFEDTPGGRLLRVARSVRDALRMRRAASQRSDVDRTSS